MKNSKLSVEEVKHVAKLAKLTLTDPEVKKFQGQLTEILNYFDVLEKMETKNIEPTSQITGLEDIFREDEIGSSLSANEVLANTKEKHGGLFVIKAIFKNKKNET
jgi:aspartyl-tRNA(Asn)/glutamyl-tRNA(Gln) amidotransferase subunit C